MSVCVRCANGLPVCSDRKPDGSRYPHAETCDTYDWGDLCAPCEAALLDEMGAER